MITQRRKACKVVAIDGPSASGKSTVARRVAYELGYLYVDSGSLYRGVTWKVLREGMDIGSGGGIACLPVDFDMDFFVGDGAVQFRIDGIEPGMELRTEAVDEKVSPLSALPEVRSKVVGWLRSMVCFGSLVMEGRDIGTAVFPDAEFKFYLDASPEERARRRHAEMAERKEQINVSEVGDALKRRDVIDSGRDMGPLKVAPDAVVIDSTLMSIDEVTRFIIERVNVGHGGK